MTRQPPATRERSILDAAVRVCRRTGINNFTFPAIAEQAECSEPLVRHYLGRLDDARVAIMRHAIAERVLWLIAQGLTLGDRTARAAPKALRDEALGSLR